MSNTKSMFEKLIPGSSKPEEKPSIMSQLLPSNMSNMQKPTMTMPKPPNLKIPETVGVGNMSCQVPQLDPEAFQKYAEQGQEKAKELAGQGMEQVRSSIEQGPEGLRLVCFVGGAALFIYGLADVIQIFRGFGNLLHYIVTAYMTLCALLTCVMEADPKWVNSYPQLGTAQARLYEYAKVVTTLWGRGIFYLFLGSLALLLHDPIISPSVLFGVYFMGMGVLLIAWHFGVGPKTVATPRLSVTAAQESFIRTTPAPMSSGSGRPA